MSRRKQAKPRAVLLKQDEELEPEMTEAFDNDCDQENKTLHEVFSQHALDDLSLEASPSTDTLGTDPSLSWNSKTADEDQNSLSPSSCATPNSVTTEGNDTEVTFTIGPTESTPYACQFCEKAFPRLSYLKKHEQSHSDQMPFKCDFCQRLFKHKRSRDRHVKLHTGDKKYRCPHCESAFSRSDHLKIHMKTHDHQKPYQCVICNRGYNTAAALTSHMQNHKKESIQSTPSPGPFRCLQCTGTFLTGEELQTHVSHHHRPISSSTPEKQEGGNNGKRRSVSPKTPSSSPSSRIRNTDLDHPSSRLMIPFPMAKLACIYCTKDSFTTMESLQLHVQAMHRPLLNGDLGESPHHLSPIETPLSTSPSDCISSVGHLACNFCTMKFPNLSSLHKHAMTVHSLSGYLQAKAKENAFCAQCAIAFPNSIAYAEHFLLFHANPHHRKPVQVCSPEPPQVKPTDLSKKNKAESGSSSSYAGLIIPAKKIKREDEESHRGSVPPSVVTAPMLTNPAISFGPHSLLCNQCNAGFPDFESFRTHLKSHLEEVVHKFVCEECESEFATEEQLENHAMAHYLTTTTEYGCQSCLKLFGKPDELQKHLMDIHAHHLYRCALCKEMFDSKVSIQVHFAVKHSNECKLFRCTSCTTIFRSEIEFQVHVKMAHLRKLSPYRCLLCNASFGSELDLQFHLSTHQKQFRCKMCDEAFHVEFLLDKHMQTHHSSVLNGDGEPTHSNHATNNNTKSGKKGSGSSGLGKGKELKCDICDKSIGSESELTSHRKLVHHISTTPMNSSSANANSDRNSGGNNSSSKAGHHKAAHNNSHLNNNTGGSHTLSLHCAYCNENCKSRSDLENHMKTHQIVSSGKHKCNICDEVCPTATLLAEHKLTHCKVISGSLCTGCKLNITSEEQFYTHMKQHSPNNSNSGGNNNNSNSSAQLPMPCIVCRQTLMTDIEIQMHARFHTKQYENSNGNGTVSGGNNNGSNSTGQSSIQCCICFRHEDKSRFVLNGLTNGVQTFLCQDCYRKGSMANSPKTSPQRDQMKYSEFEESKGKGNSHANNANNNRRTYQCIKCQMSFASEEEIQSHVASHLMNEGSNHECHLCSHVFFDSPLKLQCHLIEHTFEGCSSFTCYMCSAVFTTSTGLQQHMVEHGLHTRPYDCTQCHLKFFFRAELENHIVSHEQLKQVIVENYPPSTPSDYSKCVLNLTQESSRHSHGRKTSSAGSNTNSNGHSNNMKPKKFFYRSDDSDEEMESAVSIKKEKRDYEQISPARFNGDGSSVSDESFDDRNKLRKTPLQDRQESDDIDDHVNGSADEVTHESDRDST